MLQNGKGNTRALRERGLKTIYGIIGYNSKNEKLTELWFEWYQICAGEKHSQGTQVKDHRGRKDQKYVKSLGKISFFTGEKVYDTEYNKKALNVMKIESVKEVSRFKLRTS